MTLAQPKIGLVLLTQMLARGVRVGSPILGSDLPNSGLLNLYLVIFGHEPSNTTFLVLLSLQNPHRYKNPSLF